MKTKKVVTQAMMILGAVVMLVPVARRSGFAISNDTREDRVVSAGTTVTGTVQSVDLERRKIQVIDELGAVNTYTISNTAMTGKNGEIIDIASVKIGDAVTIEVGTDNQATKLMVRP